MLTQSEYLKDKLKPEMKFNFLKSLFLKVFLK